MKDNVTYSNVSNMAAFGVEWTGASGVSYQLCNPHDTRTLMLSAKTKDGKWISREVVEPERFGMPHKPPVSWRVFKVIAETFINDSEEDELGDDRGGS